MRITLIFFIFFTSLFVKAEGLSFLQFIEKPSKEMKLEDYLKITEREPVNDLGHTLKSVRTIRSMEKLNIKSLESKSISDKIQNIKSRIEFLSKPMGVMKLTLGETLIYAVELEEYYELSAKLKNDELNNWVRKNKNEVIAKKQKIFEVMFNHDFEVLKSSYDEMTAINENPNPQKKDAENLTPDEIKKGLIELEKMKTVLNENQKCLFDSSCHYCGLSVSPKPCSADVVGRANTIMPEKMDESIPSLNHRFEKWAK